MSYLALARKYRPGDFENVISQRHITTTLKNAVAMGRISHAYLFCGPRGTGKTTTARVLARALNCEKGPTPEPCGECTVCIEIARCSSPDVFEIDAASNRGIDDIRELRENVRYAPVGGRYKIYIIDEVHRLTKEAFDALLKTLEEPPSHVIFIFATTEPQALPATILSRTQRYDFKRIPVSSLAEAINSIARKESLAIDPDAALMIAKKADGSLRDAISLLDQLSSFSESRINAAGAAEILGIVKTEFMSNLMEAVIGHDSTRALTMFGEFIKGGGDPQELADALTGFVRTLMLVKNGVDDPSLLEIEKNEIESAGDIVADLDSLDILRFFTILADYKGAVKSGQDPRYGFEAMIVKLASLDRAVQIESLFSNSPSKPEIPEKNKTVRKNTDESDNRLDLKQTGFNSYGKPIAKSAPGADSDPAEMIKPLDINGQLDIGFLKENWSDFCKFVAQKDKKIFAHLSLSAPSKFEGKILTLGIDNNHNFQFGQLSRPENRESLLNFLKQYFGRDLKLDLIQGENAGIKPEDLPDKINVDRIFNGSPSIKKLFDSMDGEILAQ